MRFETLQEWLDWQERLHPSEIDLGLERIAQVRAAMGQVDPACPVITVAGTNGKGSCIAILEAVLSAAGYRVGSYTSPHLLRYNERVRINGSEADDAALCAAFDRIDRARGEISLTYFEFGTLAAFECLAQADLDVWLLEVGLGGRLDAVNVIDPDVAAITRIGIDHTRWLGDDREAIGREKAGILRRGRPAVCGDPEPPASVLKAARERGAALYRFGVELEALSDGATWDLRCGPQWTRDLPLPALSGGYQLGNAASALTALELLRGRLPVSDQAVRAGLAAARLPGRHQVIPGEVIRVLDVAHNPQAAQALAETLRGAAVPGRTRAVLGMLADKDVEGVVAALAGAVDEWCVTAPDAPRAVDVETLARRVRAAAPAAPVSEWPDVASALAAAGTASGPGDRVLVTGSFLTVAEAMRRGL